MSKKGFRYTRERLFPGFDGKTCKVCPQILYDGEKNAFLMYDMLLLTGMDVFRGSYISKSEDGGKTFGTPQPFPYMETNENGIKTIKHCTNGFYNRVHKKWMLLEISTSYRNDNAPITEGGVAIRKPYLSILNPDHYQEKREVTEIPFPFQYHSADPFSPPYVFENGDILVTFYYSGTNYHRCRVVSIRYALDGNTLRIVKVGEPIIGDQYGRGLCEPSLVKSGNKYYVTLRTDEVGLFAVSEDGYHFNEPKPWMWDDGSVLENYNTQQRWIRSADGGLYLVYTRKNGHNDHIFRHRAPLYITRFDEDRQCLIRAEEEILVPELGARLGNFTVTDVSDKESWVVVAEWMQNPGCEKYGSDNSIWRSKVLFE